jgi:hypothetical protein
MGVVWEHNRVVDKAGGPYVTCGVKQAEYRGLEVMAAAQTEDIAAWGRSLAVLEV